MKSFIKTITVALCALYLSSCAIIRGYRADGLNGPNIFSFEHCEHDTIAKGDQSFQFPVATNRPEWLDTLHFYNEAQRCVNMTFEEAIKDASKTQGVLIIHNDSIVYEKYWGDFSATDWPPSSPYPNPSPHFCAASQWTRGISKASTTQSPSICRN